MPNANVSAQSSSPQPRRWLASLCLVALSAAAAPAWSQAVLGSAADFGVVAASGITNTGNSVVAGNLGISPNDASSVTGFPPGVVLGTTHFADAVALDAQNDITTAYVTLAGQACTATIAGDLGGRTLTPGVYCSASSMGLTGTVTLDAGGDPGAEFIFQIGSTLTTASTATVSVINGGSNCNVFWQVGSSATLGTATNFAGNILALESITLMTNSNASGRLLARTGAVTLGNNQVTDCTQAAVPPVPPTFTPTFAVPEMIPSLSTWALLLLGGLFALLAASRFRGA